MTSPAPERSHGKLGKLPHTVDHRDLLFNEFVEPGVLAAPMKVAPVGFGHYKYISPHSWGSLGNDRYGDCVEAEAAHDTMMLNGMNGITVDFTAQSVLGTYSEVTGFNVNDPNTDQGTNMREMMNYRVHTGIEDITGYRHKIGGYCAIEPGNFTQHLQALEIFDVVSIGFQVPRSAMQQFDYGKPWTYVGDTDIIGGHCICIVGRPTAESLEGITWGSTQQMSMRFFQHYNDESYGFFTVESLNKMTGKSPEGFNLAGLQAAIGRFH